MAHLKKDATVDFQKAVLAVESRADECWKQMRLLSRPRNLATWALLTRMALEFERLQQTYGPDSFELRNMMTFWELCTCGFVFIAEHGRPASKLVQNYTWNGVLIDDATAALEMTREYTPFLNIFPMWHWDLQAADLLPDGSVRFAFEKDSPRQRQVIALQQRVRPSLEMQDAANIREHRLTLSRDLENMFENLHHGVRSRGLAKKFQYEAPDELVTALRPHFAEQLNNKFRHPDHLQLGTYTLGEFKEFYSAFMTLCGIHERVCYPFAQKGYPIPESSLVLVKSRRSWIATLARISDLPVNMCEEIIQHLTMDPSPRKATGMAIHPFVPLDGHNQELAVAPQFTLAANADDNILRALSYRDQKQFSRINTEKEAGLRARIKNANSRFNLPNPVDLPDKSTEIDLIIEDKQSSTLVLAELKWIRKPLKPHERQLRNADVDKGVQQLSTIREYARAHPEFLQTSRRLSRRIDEYSHVHYLLIAADHWFWVEPEDEFAILDFQAFLTKYAQSTDLHATVEDLLRYDWLPKEGENFHVRFDTSTVNGATIESPSFHHIR